MVRAAHLAREEARGPNAVAVIDAALAEFDGRLPGAIPARDALEHFEDYLRGIGHRQQPEVRDRAARQVSEELARQWRLSFRSEPRRYVYVVGALEIDVATAREASALLIEAIHRAGNMND